MLPLKPSIRPLTVSDIAAFASVIARVKRAEMGAERDHAALAALEASELAADLRATRAQGFVVEVGATVLGGAIVVPFEGATCELRALYLLPEARGSGLGRDLVSASLGAARQLGYERCYLETMRRLSVACALYETLGFVKLAQPRRTVPDYVDVWLECAL
jgi:putative acetyltransferase